MTSVESDQSSPNPSIARPRPGDAFAWGFPLFALCCEIILTAVDYFDRISSTLPLLLFLYVVVAVIMSVVAIMGIAALLRGRFKRAVSLLLAPFIAVPPFLFPIGPFESRALDLLRFYATKGRYDAAIEKLSPAERSNKVVFFKWGVTGILDAASYYWLVYDESGEIALPVEERSRAWRAGVPLEHRVADDHCVTSTYRLSGHYYSMVKHCADAD